MLFVLLILTVIFFFNSEITPKKQMCILNCRVIYSHAILEPKQPSICPVLNQNDGCCRFDFHFIHILAEPVLHALVPLNEEPLTWLPPTPRVLYVAFQIEIFEYMLSDYAVNQSLGGRVIIWEWHHLSDRRGLAKNKLTTSKLEWAGMAVHREVHQAHGAFCIYS